MRLSAYQYTFFVIFSAKALLLWALLGDGSEMYLYGDGAEYVGLASTLVEHWQFGNTLPNGEILDNGRRLPGYPIFLALFTFTNDAMQVQIWSAVQLCLFHVWLYAVTRWIASRHGPNSALYFIVAMSVTVPWIHYVANIHSDLQFAVLVFSSAILLISASDGEHFCIFKSVMAGVCMGAASLTRPDLIFFPMWLFAGWGFLVVYMKLKNRSLDHIPTTPTLIVVLFSFGFMFAWAIRNYFVIGRFAYTTIVDTVISFFAEHTDAPLQHTKTSLGFSETISLVFDNAGRIGSEFIPSLLQLFINPGRWYLHFYVEGLGGKLSSSGIPFSELGFSAMPFVEKFYFVAAISIHTAVIVIFFWFLILFFTRRLKVSVSLVLLVLWIVAYLVVQKTIWGALTAGAGHRYAMSIFPFFIYFGALVFSKTDVAKPYRSST